MEEHEYKQVRQFLADTMSFGHIAELSETVMPRVRPKKVIHFQPMFSIFPAGYVRTYRGRTPWYDRVFKDQFGSADDYSRKWIFFYRSCSPMKKYVCDYSALDPTILVAFGLKTGLGELRPELADWRTCITTKTNTELVTILNVEGVDAGN